MLKLVSCTTFRKSFCNTNPTSKELKYIQRENGSFNIHLKAHFLHIAPFNPLGSCFIPLAERCLVPGLLGISSEDCVAEPEGSP